MSRCTLCGSQGTIEYRHAREVCSDRSAIYIHKIFYCAAHAQPSAGWVSVEQDEADSDDLWLWRKKHIG